jgi:hypothetical protein
MADLVKRFMHVYFVGSKTRNTDFHSKWLGTEKYLFRKRQQRNPR